MSENTSTESPTEEGPQTLREALQQSFDEHSAPEPTEPESTESEPTEDDAQPATDAAAEADETPPSEGEPQGDANEAVVLAPEHWPAEDREMFTHLSADAQEYLLKREKQYEQGIQSKAEEQKEIHEAFGPYRDILKMRGVDEATAIRTWAAAQQMLDTDPVNGFKTLIQQFTPDVQEALRAEFGQREPAVDDQYVDPEVKQLREELQQTKQQNTQSQAQYQQLRQQEALEQVKQFREATDDKGNSLHPHFDKVSDDMRALLMAGTVPDLQAAYEKAVWSLPEYRDEFASQQRKEAEREEARRREAAANKAKKTAKAVQGKSSVPPPPPKTMTLRDELRETWNQSIKGEL